MTSRRAAIENAPAEGKPDAELDRVTVAVRLRPWVDAQNGKVVHADRSVIRINNSTAEVVDLRTGASRGRYTFDKCFDSFSENEAHYAPQSAVFDELAPPLLRSAMDGYNVTVFAYGQTGSGKSYTMLGTRDSPGFIPRFVDALFDACADVTSSSAASDASAAVQCSLEASYLEIYMEQIRDLLNPSKVGTRKGALRVREHPRTGPYVEDLAKVACKTSDEVQMVCRTS